MDIENQLYIENMNATQPNLYSVAVWTYVPPIIIIAGTIGHILTTIAVQQRKMTSFTIYLTALAFVDTLVLYTQTLNLWLNYALGIVIKEHSPFLCKMHYFIGFLFTHMSSWLVMCLTIERTLCMYFPHKIGQFPGKRVGLAVVGGVLLFLCALNSHTLYGRDFVIAKNSTACGFIDENYRSFFYMYWNRAHFTIYFLLPVTVIILGNSAIVIQVYRSTKETMISDSVVTRRRTRHLFIMTLLLSISFVILVSPFPLLFLIAPVNILALPATVFYQMLYLNHAINFFLYVLSGHRFRSDLKSAFKRFACFTMRTDTQREENVTNIYSIEM